MMDLAEMRAYEAVVRERGFTAAAQTLGLSKQRVSDLVRGLEDRLEPGSDACFDDPVMRRRSIGMEPFLDRETP